VKTAEHYLFTEFVFGDMSAAAVYVIRGEKARIYYTNIEIVLFLTIV
jgi:hypothetical protein